jgi:hypothetical protein
MLAADQVQKDLNIAWRRVHIAIAGLGWAEHRSPDSL